MNNIIDELKNIGYAVPEPKEKIESSKINLADKMQKCREYMENAHKAVNAIDDVPDTYMTQVVIDSAVLNYQRYVEALKDILLTICNKESIELSVNKSLSEVIRKTMGLFHVDKSVEGAVKALTDRNDVVHDYMNSGYYDEQVIKHIVNHYHSYIKHFEQVKNFCELKGYI